MNSPLDIERSLAATAFKHMEAHNIAPTPENFTIWYHYALGKNADLADEINKCIAQKMPFGNNACIALYQRFFVAEPNQRILDDTPWWSSRTMKPKMATTNHAKVADLGKASRNVLSNKQS